ncbi:MAG: hypothetical protein QGH33_13205, partial [Pirellulaceae bacterium]|nr:hypothetical protein [Pirellulaceae bacterium]
MVDRTVRIGFVVCCFTAALMCNISNAQADDNESGQRTPRRTAFVNSLGMKMIRVKAARFNAWTPSMDRYLKMSHAGEQPDVAFGQNRPHVPIPVDLEADFYLAEFPTTNGMYRQFAEATGRPAPGGQVISFYWQLKHVNATWGD